MKDCTRKNSDLPLDLAEFLGWHVGDGCISINERYSEVCQQLTLNQIKGRLPQ